MARTFKQRLAEIATSIAGREPSGDAAPPRPGTDPTSRRHLLALLLGTLAIMIAGVVVAIVDDGSSDAAPTPTVVTAPSPAGARGTAAPVAVVAV